MLTPILYKTAATCSRRCYPTHAKADATTSSRCCFLPAVTLTRDHPQPQATQETYGKAQYISFPRIRPALPTPRAPPDAYHGGMGGGGV